MFKLNQLCTVGREILLKYLPKNSCVSSTRFALELIDFEGSYEQPVYLVAIGSKDLTVVGRPAYATNDDYWQGHLVCISGNILLDLSLDQVDGLHADFFELTPCFSEGVPMIVAQGEYILIYWADHDNYNYRQFDSWQEKWKLPYAEFKNRIE